ncbi:MAG: hypothetical protein ACP5E5_04995 [Acidobacteriaceae bacterium]
MNSITTIISLYGSGVVLSTASSSFSASALTLSGSAPHRLARNRLPAPDRLPNFQIAEHPQSEHPQSEHPGTTDTQADNLPIDPIPPGKGYGCFIAAGRIFSAGTTPWPSSTD